MSRHLARGWTPLLVSLIASVAEAREPGRPFARALQEHPYSVQLHLHGPLSEFNASMEWHVRKAHDAGIDVLWWTEHDWRVSLNGYTTAFDFEHASWDAATKRFAQPDANAEQSWWQIMLASGTYRASLVDSVAAEGSRSLRLSLPGADLQRFATLELVQSGSRRQNHYPLAAGLHLRFALRPDSFDPANDKFVVQAKMSEHATDWPVLRYVIGTTDGEAVSAIPLTYVAGRWNHFDLDLSADARRLLSTGVTDSVPAQDNSLVELRVILAARGDNEPVVFFDDVHFDAGVRRGLSLLDWQRTAADYYESVVPDVRQLVGTEISRNRPQAHMNAYLPHAALVDYTGHPESERLYWAVQQVHALGGLVSYNHAFGPGVYMDDPRETPEQRAARVLAVKHDQLATRLYGCDLLEVGYRVRGGIDLAGHLDLWDCLTSNAIFTTGVGTTDSHGSEFSYGWAPWQGAELYENNYVTWIWATDKTAVPLLQGMAAGAAYFGDPYRWKGELDLATMDGFRMGSVVVTDKAAEDVVVRVTHVPPSVELRLRQGEIRTDAAGPATDVHWLRTQTLPVSVEGGVLTDTVRVNLDRPTFVRFEIWNDGLEWAFSNPIHFLQAVPLAGIPAARVAASLGPVRVQQAEGLALRRAEWSADAERLSLDVDETTPGLGRIDADVASLGAPVSVRGASTWNVEDGVLTLRGFAGRDSKIQVSWLDALPTPIDRVDLSAGRPNPFRGDVAVDFALPDPAQALVEVLDVNGRRVRILRDEWTLAGRHQVRWDGNDSFGREAADGVYWLRLRALGVTRTVKAVKVR